MPLRHLDVVDTDGGSALVNLENAVTLIAQVTDSHVRARRVGHRGAEQNRFFRTAAGPTNTA
jgi:hypothetical protein